MDKSTGLLINLEKKTAIVTGGSMGIGAEITYLLLRCGSNVAVIDRQEPTGKIAENFGKYGKRFLFLQADISNYSKTGQVIEKVLENFGRIDILVNNAGINHDGVIWKITEAQWDSVINVNLKGYFNFIRAVSPLFREQKSGKIVNITSINGLRGKFGQANYAAAKAGIIGLTKTVARELGKYSVNVNAVAPGLIETDMMKNADEIVREKAMEEIILKRFGQTEDIANIVAFLSSDLSRHITGEVIKVDGGQYI